MKKKYKLKKEVKEELMQLGIEVLGIMLISGIVLLMLLVNGILF